MRWDPRMDHSCTTAVCGVHPNGKPPDVGRVRDRADGHAHAGAEAIGRSAPRLTCPPVYGVPIFDVRHPKNLSSIILDTLPISRWPTRAMGPPV